jgi:indolepyruvate ferredoxin oxidoreductase beta subunit
MNYDIYLVGVGGQGLITVGKLLSEAATQEGVPANFYPTKGMAQRGGFVKAQLRLGREVVGPTIAERGADLVIAMELSEALKAVRFAKPGGEFLLYGHVWAPTAVMLGRADYPAREAVLEEIRRSGAQVRYLDPTLPEYEALKVPANLYVLGAAVGQTRLGEVLSREAVMEAIERHWLQGRDLNRAAFNAGLAATVTEGVDA